MCIRDRLVIEDNGCGIKASDLSRVVASQEEFLMPDKVSMEEMHAYGYTLMITFIRICSISPAACQTKRRDISISNDQMCIRDRKAAPKQAENVGVGSVIPRSVPANLAVNPDKK